MWSIVNRTVQLIALPLMGIAALGMPSDLKAQSTDSPVMRLVCFDSAETDRVQGDGRWAIVVTQLSSETFAADIFIPDDNGEYLDRFPMFENTEFFFSVFENVPSQIGTEGIARVAEELFSNNATTVSKIAEGRRVGTLLDLSLEGAGSFKFDSIDPSLNHYSDPSKDEQRVPVCETPFLYQQNSN